MIKFVVDNVDIVDIVPELYRVKQVLNPLDWSQFLVSSPLDWEKQTRFRAATCVY